MGKQAVRYKGCNRETEMSISSLEAGFANKNLSYLTLFAKDQNGDEGNEGWRMVYLAPACKAAWGLQGLHLAMSTAVVPGCPQAGLQR